MKRILLFFFTSLVLMIGITVQGKVLDQTNRVKSNQNIINSFKESEFHHGENVYIAEGDDRQLLMTF